MKYATNILKEFKSFALRGSVMDLAIGIIIGAGFNSVVNSLVKDIITPPIGFILGKVDFADLSLSIGGTATINYGLFINALISFLITAWVVFLLVRLLNRLQRSKIKETPPPNTKACPFCTRDIPIKATRCPECTSELPDKAAL